MGSLFLAPGLLPGTRIFPQPEAAKASLQMHLLRWPRGRLPKPKRLTAGTFPQGCSEDTRMQLEGLTAKATTLPGFLGEAYITLHPYLCYSSYAESHGALSGTLPAL